MRVRIPIALIAGLLFGAGLACSGMSDPTRVRAFLIRPEAAGTLRLLS